MDKIGTRIIIEVVEGKDCKGCVWWDECYGSAAFECRAEDRADHKDVIYKVIQWGE